MKKYFYITSLVTFILILYPLISTLYYNKNILLTSIELHDVQKKQLSFEIIHEHGIFTSYGFSFGGDYLNSGYFFKLANNVLIYFPTNTYSVSKDYILSHEINIDKNHISESFNRIVIIKYKDDMTANLYFSTDQKIDFIMTIDKSIND